jgi:hypothetical protein
VGDGAERTHFTVNYGMIRYYAQRPFWPNEAIKGFCGACRRENRLGRTRWNGVDRFAAAMEFSGGATGRRRHGVAGGGLGGVKLVGVGGWWTIEADGNRA